MSDERQWQPISEKLFRGTQVPAPPFLWTRILAAIEQREQELAVWWRQWRWMGRVAAVMTVLVTLSAGWVFYENTQNRIEQVFYGITTPQQSFEIASADIGEEGPWVQN
jgi:hypothetical protein